MTPFDNNSIMYVVYVDDYHVSPVIELSFSYVTHTACRLLLQHKAMKMRKCTNSICNIEISIISRYFHAQYSIMNTWHTLSVSFKMAYFYAINIVKCMLTESL